MHWRRFTSCILRRLGLSQLFIIKFEGIRLRFHPAAMPINLWEDSSRYLPDRLFFRRFLKKDDVCLDIGANIGLLTIVAAQTVGQNGTVFSVEAHPRTYRFLEENLRLNRLNNVTKYNMALGNQEGFLSFSDRISDDTNHVLLNGNGLRIPVTTFDNITRDMDRINLLKLDIEGYEKIALQKACRTLDITDCICFESYDKQFERYGYNSTDLIAIFKKASFNIYSFPDTNGVVSKIDGQHFSPYVENLIATKNINQFTERTGFQVRQ